MDGDDTVEFAADLEEGTKGRGLGLSELLAVSTPPSGGGADIGLSILPVEFMLLCMSAVASYRISI